MSTTSKFRIMIITLSIIALVALAAAPASQASSDVSQLNYWGYMRKIAPAGGEAPQAAAQAASWAVVASGLNNPRGLTFGADSALYVAEAGVGGTDPCVESPEGGTVCYGPTGQITRIDLANGTQAVFAANLPSRGDPTSGGFASDGPVDVSPRLMGLDVIIGWGGDPADRAGFGEVGYNFGRTARVLNNGLWGFFADVSAYEETNNPDGGAIDSNPYSIAHIGAGMRAVVDAGGNDLLSMAVNGRLETLAVFPDRLADAPPFLGLPPGAQIPMQSVPNAVTKGPDGALYVGQLTGFPFPVGGANVYRLGDPLEGPEVFASGFTNIIDIAFDQDGNLYVLEITHNGLLSEDFTGALWKVDAGTGDRTMLAMDGLVTPAGLAIGDDGSIYVSNYGVFPGAGEVIRLVDAAPSGPLASAVEAAPVDSADTLTRTYLPLANKR